MNLTQLDRIESKIDKLLAAQGIEGSVDAPPKDPVTFEDIFGPKPSPSVGQDYSTWLKHKALTGEILQFVPAEYVAGAYELLARTGVKPVFLYHDGRLRAILEGGVNPWFTDPENFVGSNVEGIIRSVLNSQGR